MCRDWLDDFGWNEDEIDPITRSKVLADKPTLGEGPSPESDLSEKQRSELGDTDPQTYLEYRTRQ